MFACHILRIAALVPAALFPAVLFPAVLFSAALAPETSAHDPGLSSTTISIDRTSTTAHYELRIDVGDLVDGTATDFDVVRSEQRLRQCVDRWLGLQGSASRIGPLEIDIIEGDDVRIRFTRETGDSERFRFQFDAFEEMPRGHRHFVSIADAAGRPLRNALLSMGNVAIAVALDSNLAADSSVSRSAIGIAGSFLWLGVEHIWIGYDHILFLLGLLIAAKSIRTAIAWITAFTVAHSMTLVGASLGVISIPIDLVEIIIALSVAFVAVENLSTKKPRHRWGLTFGFGLIHGFGFASVLSELHAGTGASGSDSLISLLSFNLGVELGQVAIAALALPVFVQIQRSAKAGAWLRFGLNAALLAAGLFWAIERTLGVL